MRDELARGDRAWGLTVLALFLALLLPLFMIEVPPLGDYLNHLARGFILSALPGDPILSRMYAVRWAIIPNLGFDLVVPPLLRWLPIHDVGRAAIGAGALLPMLGVIAYHRAIAGRFGWWSLGACLTAYSGCLLYGFLNFELGLGLALLLATPWLAWRETHPTLAIGLAAAGAPILFICHLMGLLFFGLLIGAAELAHLWPFNLREAVRRGLVLLLVFAVPLALYEVSALSDMGGEVARLPLGRKLDQLGAAFIGYDTWSDRAAVALAFGVPFGALLLRRGRFPAQAAIALLGLAAAYAATPYAWKGTFMLDTRFAVMLAIMMFAGFVPNRWSRGAAIGIGAAAAVVFLLRLGVLVSAWHAQAPVLVAVRNAMSPLRPGQTVMVADASPAEAPAYWATDPHRLRLANGVTLSANLGALALIEHRAWWPFEFDNVSQQPIRTREPYDTLARRAVELPDRTRLLSMDLCGFDDVLLTDAEAVPPLPSDRFRRIAGSGFAVLYAVTVCNPT